MKTLYSNILHTISSLENGCRIELAQMGDKSEYSELINKYVSVSYPETESDYGANLFNQYIKGITKGHTTKRIIWRLVLGNDTLGYLTASIKDNNCVKLGPFVLKPIYVNKGYASFFTKYFVDYFTKIGIFKLYATAPSNNQIACGYLIANNFYPEVKLVNQYSLDNDEVVFGRVLNSKSVCTIKPSTSSRGDHDDALLEFPSYPHKHFYSDENLCGIAYPKRGGAVRLEFLLKNDYSIKKFISESKTFFKTRNRHKLYVLLNKSESKMHDILLSQGFTIEGCIVTQSNIDNLFVISCFL